MFTFMMAPFSAGLVIYWAWSNTLSICQQYFIMKRHGTPIGGKGKVTVLPPVAETPTAPEKKKGGKGSAKKG
jgi:YidC/Oxa1 family membrane protein insertase